MKNVRERLFQAGMALYLSLFGQNRSDRKPVFAGSASEYKPGDADDPQAIFVGEISLSELDQICPRYPEVQTLTDLTAAEVRDSGDYKNAQDFGNKVHKKIADKVDALKDPDFVAEISYDIGTGEERTSGTKGTLELDLLEHVRPATACIYDYKTGKADLRPRRAVDLMTLVQKKFGTTYRYIMIMIKPSR